MRGLMQNTDEERAAKQLKSALGGAIPRDQGRFETTGLATVREKAKVREEQKKGRISTPRTIPLAERKGKKRRWVGRGEDELAGQTASTDGVAGQTATRRDQRVTLCILAPHGDPDLRGPLEMMRRRGWHTVGNMAQYLRHVISNSSACRYSVIVTSTLHSQSFVADEFAVLCRAAGGFLTTKTWFLDGYRRGQPPVGIFTGVHSAPITVCITLLLAQGGNTLGACCRVFDEASTCALRMVSQVELAKKWNEYVATRGPRSRPWTKLCVVAVDEGERNELVSGSLAALTSGVCTVDGFLARFSPAKRDVKCPGNWHRLT